MFLPEQVRTYDGNDLMNEAREEY